MSTRSALHVTAEELNRLIAESRKLPVAVGAYASEDFEPYADFMTNVLLTVLDLQMHNVAVNKSIAHYRTHRWHDVRTLNDLERVLSDFPDTGCAAPLLTLLGIAGAAPAAATFVFAGAVFATVVAVGAVSAGSRHSVSTRDVRHEGRVDIELTDHRGRRSGVHP